MKKVISLMLSLVMIISITAGMSFNVSAATNPYNYYATDSAGNWANCTWWAWQLVYDNTGVALPAWGNAGTWYNSAVNAGYPCGTTPKVNSVAVHNSGGYGHVQFVTQVNGSQIYVKEGGVRGTSNGYHEGWTSTSGVIGYIYCGGDNTGPSVSNFYTYGYSDKSFLVTANVTDTNGIKSVSYAIWTSYNGQDDLKWNDTAITSPNYYTSRIQFSDHNNERGTYIIDLYAYDNYGNVSTTRISYDFPDKGPSISNVKVTNVSSSGYTVTCTVNATSQMGVSRVQFPTWTSNNGQDDIASEWWSNTKVSGTILGNTVTFRVNASEHNNETGIYNTHIYAYDQIDNVTLYHAPYVNVHNHVQVTDPAIDATCTKSGKTQGIHCSVCNEVLLAQKTIMAKGHTQATDLAVEPTCTTKGKTEGKHCSVCNKILVAQKTIDEKGHTWDSGTLTQATLTADGAMTYECTTCGAVLKTEPIAHPQTIRLSKTSYTYDGKVKKPTVSVKDSNGKTITSSNYTVTYSSVCKNVGKYAVKITFKGNYNGTKTFTYTINPKGTSVSKLTKPKTKQIKVAWKKQTTQTTGYQIQYSTSKTFKSGNKIATVTSNKGTSKTLTGLKAKKTYYVRIRTYKTVKGTKYYSAWSTAKYIKTK